MKPHPLLRAIVAGAALACAVEAFAESAPSADHSATTEKKPEFPAIREFDVETLARLGREIYRHDQLAWHATDALFAQISPAAFQSDGGCGWVVDTSGPQPLVRFVRKPRMAAIEEAAYDITFPGGGKPVVTVPTDRTLTPHQIACRAAYRTAVGPFERRQFPLCRVPRGSYNYVVLDDPSGLGLLVYLLRPKDTDDAVPVGGHYRISVSADGKTLKQLDRLSASCIALDKRGKEAPEGSKIVAHVTSHIVSNTPVETHVFVALQDKIQLNVVTPDGRIWDVSNGRIIQINTEHAEEGKLQPKAGAK
ncbi:MAG: hypothetical protein QM790_11195 [Nibricoccus sp.]